MVRWTVGEHTLMTDKGLVVHMLIEKKYPLKKEIVVQMLKLKLESEEESTMELELIRFIKKERISKKRTKNEAKTTKPDTEWKSVEKTKSSQSPSLKKSTKVNPDKSKVKPEATSEEKSLGAKIAKSLNLFNEGYKENDCEGLILPFSQRDTTRVLKIHTDDNVVDLLTKAFDVSRGLIEFRELLSRVTNGTEALLIPTLFILWLDKVSTDSAKLVPLGKVCTALETLKKNTAKALISLLTTISLSSTMAVLDSCPQHNLVACLEKSEGNAEFHEIIDFLKRSSIHHALTVSPVVSTTFVEQFWTSAKSKTINNVRHITAKVAGKSVSISEASIRSDLLFDDADGIDSLPNQAIFDAIQLMGSKSTSWDQIPTNIATAVICLTSN
ncbi:hypothetical protein Tco_1547931 [Tanacetum coccineum]